MWHLVNDGYFASADGEDPSGSTRNLIPRSYLEKVPMPTLYNGTVGGPEGPTDSGRSHGAAGSSVGGGKRLGVIELLLYNMSSTLASVAAGYDVRLSNVTAIHPKLHPKQDDGKYWYGDQRQEQPSLYPHNTYHGPTPHHRTPLSNADFKPIRFTESHHRNEQQRKSATSRSSNSSDEDVS